MSSRHGCRFVITFKELVVDLSTNTGALSIGPAESHSMKKRSEAVCRIKTDGFTPLKVSFPSFSCLQATETWKRNFQRGETVCFDAADSLTSFLHGVTFCGPYGQRASVCAQINHQFLKRYHKSATMAGTHFIADASAIK